MPLLTGNAADAEDLLQTALTKAYRRWRHISSMESPHAYLRRIITHCFVDQRRHHSAHATAGIEFLDMADPGDYTGQTDDLDAIARGLDRLTLRQRAVLVLRYLLDLTDEDIADELGCSSATVAPTPAVDWTGCAVCSGSPTWRSTMTEDLQERLPVALERLAEQAPAGPVDVAGIRRRAAWQRRWPIALPVALVLIIVACVWTGVTLSKQSGMVAGVPVAGSTCTPLHTGAPPVWARGGFTGNSYPPFATSASGNVVAHVFGDALTAPPAADHSNKILWVERRDAPTGNIDITARLAGSDRVTTLLVPAGPSIVNMPTAGCWHLDLRIGTRHDTIQLRRTRP